jgi:hypothetical protein
LPTGHSRALKLRTIVSRGFVSIPDGCIKHRRTFDTDPSRLRKDWRHFTPAEQQRELYSELVAHKAGGADQKLARNSTPAPLRFGDNATDSAHPNPFPCNFDFAVEYS